MIQTLAFPAKKTSMPRMNKELFEGNAVKRPKEGVERRKFNNAETELIIKTREKMVLEGKNDTDISIVLGQLLGRNRRSMHTKLMIMVKMGKMPKNPNVTEIKKFDYSEIETVTAVRAELIGKCKDSEIIRILADKLGRNEGSIEGLIRKMILKKKFGENPNRQVKFSDSEIELVKTRRTDLIKIGKNDWEISKAMVKETGKSKGSLHTYIKKMIKSGNFEENPNKQGKFSSEEIDNIEKRRMELILQRITDREISNILANEMRKNPKSMDAHIRSHVKTGKFTSNPNKRKTRKFSNNEIKTIRKRRDEMIIERKNDREISIALGKEIGRSWGSIHIFIRNCVKSKKFDDNHNNHKRFGEQELETIKRIREELVAEGKKDGEISRIISREMKRTMYSIYYKIRIMVKAKELPDNPNNRGRKFSEDEISRQLDHAVDTYLSSEGEIQ